MVKQNSIIRLTLMNKNIKVVDFDYHTGINQIIKVYHEYPDNEKYAPFSTYNRHSGVNDKILNIWFQNRLMPESLVDLRDYKNNYNKFVTDSILKYHGFNLIDEYWFKDSLENLTWEDGNSFDNDGNPEIFTNGKLPKKWISEDGVKYLIKGGTDLNIEPFNEVIASKLYERVLKKDEYVKYTLYNNDGIVCSKCESFINKDTEFVSAFDITKTKKKTSCEEEYNFFNRCAVSLGLDSIKDFINKMLTLDYILGNSDRNYNNFGAIRDSNTLEFIKMAPLFDNGDSLNIDEYESKPFHKAPLKQLELVDDLTWLDFKKLDGFDKVVSEIFKQNNRLSKEYIEKVISSLYQRIDNLKEYYQKLNK